jgi:hypothetical protein
MDAKALLKFGHRSPSADEVRRRRASFRKAVEITRGGADRMLHARAAAFLHDTLRTLGRAQESHPVLLQAYERARNADAPRSSSRAASSSFFPPDSEDGASR